MLCAAEPQAIPLWPNDPAPDKESIRIGPNDEHRRVINVTRPTITPMLAAPGNANGAAVIILPGGAWRHLAIDKEGNDVAKWLNTLGVAGFVVRYRVMLQDQTTPADLERVRGLGFTDTQEAIRMVRARAAEWKIDPKRIGVIGFSAGGYFAAAAAARYGPENRPDFAVCVYPAAPADLKFPADAPPMLLIHADDDRLAPKDNSIKIYLALKEAKIPAELHIFARGGHGFGMPKQNAPTDNWTERMRDWMSAAGLLKR